VWIETQSGEVLTSPPLYNAACSPTTSKTSPVLTRPSPAPSPRKLTPRPTRSQCVAQPNPNPYQILPPSLLAFYFQDISSSHSTFTRTLSSRPTRSQWVAQPNPNPYRTLQRSLLAFDFQDISSTHSTFTCTLSSKANPQTDPIPMRRTAEPESISDATSSSYASHGSPTYAAAHQHIFDHRRDDPVQFSVLARPSSTHSGLFRVVR